MRIALSSTGYPQRELPQLLRLLPELMKIYQTFILSIPPDIPSEDLNILKSFPDVHIVVNQDWSQGRYSAIQKALDTFAEFIHYADLDRILHWVETNPAEWKRAVACIEKTDCLILGRTEKAFITHPLAVQQTERIINSVFSCLLEKPVDLGGGSRGFSRQAAEYLMRKSKDRSSWCTDSEWVMLIYQSGFHWDYLAVDGLEFPDHTENYDMDVKHWAFRTQIALEIIRSGIDLVKGRNGCLSKQDE